MIKRMQRFLSTTEFITGAFLGFVLTTLAFTYILTMFYTPNILIEGHGFYRDGKRYKVIEYSEYRELKHVKR